MSENNGSGASIADLLALYKHNGDLKSGYINATPEAKRVAAVACALELIRNSTVGLGNAHVDTELSSLSKFADRIQAALTVK